MNKVSTVSYWVRCWGTFDGMAVQFRPGVKPELLTIIVGPALRGFGAGVLIGVVVRKILSSDRDGIGVNNMGVSGTPCLPYAG